jgi:hypothetical protein
VSARLLAVALLLGVATLAGAAEVKRPDFSGFWMPSKFIAAGTVEMKDSGAAEFGAMNFGGLKPTPEALAAAQAWKPEMEMTLERVCRIPSIVYAQQGPFPMEIFQGTELMLMRLEYFDMARVIFLDGRGPWPADAPHTKTGYSTGHFEGDVLVVTTTHLKEATITNNGLEHSDQMRVIERFRLTDGGRTLKATQEYEDPKALENRGMRFMSWKRTEGDHVHAYDCDPSFVENYRK